MNTSPDHHAVSLSRSASRASARSRNSTISRNQSLIKKNIELQDLKPADVLIERFVAWKAIVKQLTAYFEGIADIENNTARELTKLAGVIQVPFRAGNQFLGEGGLQDVYYDIRDKTRVIADQHADLGRTIDSSIVQHLQKLRAEIKAHIKNVQNDTGKLAAGVARERELSTKLVGELANAISTFKNTPMNIQARNDPFVANQAVSRQLSRQVLEENLLQKSIIMMQQNSAHFEEGIVKALQSAWQTFDEWQSRAHAGTQNQLVALSTHFRGLQPDREWIQFAARSDHLLDPDTPLRDPEAIRYPLKDDPSVAPVHTGHMERKKRFTRAYKEAYFVLTPAGFLHEYASSDGARREGQTPTFSLFLPSCTLGPASGPRASSHKFLIEGRKDGLGTSRTKSGSFKGLLGSVGGGDAGSNAKAWSFRARSRDEMMEWWNDIRMLCARYLVASEQVDRTGPVEEAVRSVGYVSEEYEEEEDEEDEEELEEERGRGMEVQGLGEEVRGRTGPAPTHVRRIVVHDQPPPAHINSEGAVADHADDGSSVEEETDEHEIEQEPPVYTHPTGDTLVAAPNTKGYLAEKGYAGQGVEIGPNGYAIEKKIDPEASYRPAHFHHAAPDYVAHAEGEVRSQRASVNVVGEAGYGEAGYGEAGRGEAGYGEDAYGAYAARGGEPAHGDEGQDGNGGYEKGTGGGMKVERRLSKRQMEKTRAESRGSGTPPPPIQLRDNGVAPSHSQSPSPAPAAVAPSTGAGAVTSASRPGGKNRVVSTDSAAGSGKNKGSSGASRHRSPPPPARDEAAVAGDEDDEHEHGEEDHDANEEGYEDANAEEEEDPEQEKLGEKPAHATDSAGAGLGGVPAGGEGKNGGGGGVGLLGGIVQGVGNVMRGSASGEKKGTA